MSPQTFYFLHFQCVCKNVAATLYISFNSILNFKFELTLVDSLSIQSFLYVIDGDLKLKNGNNNKCIVQLKMKMKTRSISIKYQENQEKSSSFFIVN